MKKKFRVIIAGSRTFYDYEKLKSSCDNLLKDKKSDEIIVVSGGARGADYLGLRWAADNGHDFVLCPAKWKQYGKPAGYRRNQEMAEQADALIAFWDGKSSGTKHMINIAKEKKIPTRIVKF